MNAYIYFANRSRTFPSIQPEHRAWFARAWHDVQNRNLPVPAQDALLQPVVEALSLPDVAGDQVKADLKTRLQQHPFSWVDEFSDFFAFAFVYAGLYQGVFLHYIDPLLQGQSVISVMDCGWNLLFSTLMVYFIFKGLLLVLSMQQQGLSRWLLLGGCFFLYLGGLYGSRYLPAGFAVPVWLVVLVLGVLAAGMHRYLMNHFALQHA